MSYSLDVNILLYASDRSSEHYAHARRFLDSCITGAETLYLTWPTLISYLRIATHPRIFSAPLSPDEAFRNVATLSALPHARTISELDGFLEAYEHVAADISIRGNLVPDAHIAAILFQHGVRTIYSKDRDFRKFRWLDLRDPFS